MLHVALAIAASMFCAASDPQSPHIRVKEAVVFDGNRGWEHDGVTYRLACGACIAQMPNGDVLCWWLSGSDNEPSTDNNVLASRSTDNGKTWGEPYILVPAGKNAGSLTAMHATPDGKVIAFGAEWPSELHYTVWHYFRMESTDNGYTWSPREPVTIRESDDLMFQRPIRLQNGEYFSPTSFFEKRPVPLPGSIAATAQAKSEAEALALPPDPAEAAKSNKFLTHLHGCSALTTSDPGLRNLVEHGGVRNRPLGLLESTAVQLKDGRIVMLMRAEYGGFLWRTESNDNGRTWADAWQTDIPNPTSLPALIRLPDGRIALIHNAVGGVVGANAKRDPLSIWLSDDEMQSWCVKDDVITGGSLAYPCPLILDGRLVFSYDRNRREARFVEVELPPADVPASSDSMLLWLDAADASSLRLDGEFVDSWANKAPNGARAAFSAGKQRPRWMAHQGTPLRAAVRFDGIDDVLRIPEFGQRADAWTLVMLCAPYDPLKGGGLCSASPKDGHDYDPGFTVDLYQAASAFDQISVEGAGRIGGQKNQMKRSFPCGGMHVVTVIRKPEEIALFIDGVAEGVRPATAATTVMDELRIGARYFAGMERDYFHGEIAQLVLYGRALSDEERTSVERAALASDEERAAGETEAVQEAVRTREERMKNRMENRMKPPKVVHTWPSIEAFRVERMPSAEVAALPARKDLKEAIAMGVRHMNSLFDRDRNDEPFFFANCMSDGTGKMFHSVNIGIPHVVGRCLLACMQAEMAVGVPFPADGLSILERYCRSSFDNPDHLNSYFDPDKENARFIEFHNMREGLYGLWALAAGRDSAWARETGHAMLETLDRLADGEGRWSVKRIEELGMKGRCFGVCVPNATRLVDALLAYYDCTQDPLAMKLAGLYAKRGLEEMYLPDGRFAPMLQSSGHVHSITSSLSGIAAYAARTQDHAMLEACCRIMDVGVPEYFSSWGWGDEVFPEHPADEISRGEINQTGDVMRTALILGANGFPRYFELAERYLRSMMLPTQHREDELRRYLKDKPEPADDSERDVLNRTIGGYAMQLPNDRMRKGDWPLSTLDITSGAVHAMSECYRHRVDVVDGICTVNLLFDSENDAVAIQSGLPFQGSIRFTARKPLQDLRVALPGWLRSETLHANVNGSERDVSVHDGYIELGALQRDETGTLAFDIPCREETETVDGTEYTTTWAGSQIIEILPRGEVSPLPF